MLGARHAGDVQASSAEEQALLDSLHLSALPALRDDPSNAWQGSPAAAELGRQLFFDKRLSANQAVACASCHDPARQFQDGKPVGEGQGIGMRRSMPIADAGYSPWLFWDGRKDSLWSQALGPLEDPLEHGGNRMRFARLMQANYPQAYLEVFGELPDLAQLPEDASPRGNAVEQAVWQSMPTVAQEAVSRVFANMGKGQCVSCHNGPLLTDHQFHNTGVPPRETTRPDAGRSEAIARVRADEFNCLGRFSDAWAEQCQELRFLGEDESMTGAFRTPGLRGVASRPPYMHAGQIKSLAEVVRHYVQAPHSWRGARTNPAVG